jgi:hypothetical protein
LKVLGVSVKPTFSDRASFECPISSDQISVRPRPNFDYRLKLTHRVSLGERWVRDILDLGSGVDYADLDGMYRVSIHSATGYRVPKCAQEQILVEEKDQHKSELQIAKSNNLH